MKDFDKIFSDRLNEEGSFPNQGKNWDKLSGRLDVAAGALATAKALLWWKIAAIGLLAVSGLLFWKTNTVKQENTRLEQTVVELENRLAKQQPALKIPGSDDAPETEGRANTTEFSKNENTAATTRQPARYKPGLNKSVLPKVRPTVETTTGDFGNLKNFRDIDPAHENNQESDLGQNLENLSTKTLEPAKTKTENTVAQALSSLPKNPAAPVSAGSPRLICLQTAPALSLTKPFREKPNRWRAGVQFSALQAGPGQAESYRFAGAGLNAAFAPLRNLWLTTAVDQFSGLVTTGDKPPAWFFNGKIPKGWGHHNELTQIEARPRQLHLSLGLRYVVPMRFPLRPAVHLSHSWIRNDAGIYRFTFEDKDPHPNPGPGPGPKDKAEYLAERDAVRYISNVWKLGAGLDWETRSWVFHTGAEWLEGGKANSPIFDAFVFRAGVQHKF